MATNTHVLQHLEKDLQKLQRQQRENDDAIKRAHEQNDTVLLAHFVNNAHLIDTRLTALLRSISLLRTHKTRRDIVHTRAHVVDAIIEQNRDMPSAEQLLHTQAEFEALEDGIQDTMYDEQPPPTQGMYVNEHTLAAALARTHTQDIRTADALLSNLCPPPTSMTQSTPQKTTTSQTKQAKAAPTPRFMQAI